MLDRLETMKKYTFKGTYVSLVGAENFLKKVEEWGGNVPDALVRVLQRTAEKPAEEMQNYMSGHIRTGDTYRSFTNRIERVDANFINYYLGYDMKKGGLPALFLDVGTPKIKPSFFIYYAKKNHEYELMQVMWDEMDKIGRELLAKLDKV